MRPGSIALRHILHFKFWQQCTNTDIWGDTMSIYVHIWGSSCEQEYILVKLKPCWMQVGGTLNINQLRTPVSLILANLGQILPRTITNSTISLQYKRWLLQKAYLTMFSILWPVKQSSCHLSSTIIKEFSWYVYDIYSSTDQPCGSNLLASLRYK